MAHRGNRGNARGRGANHQATSIRERLGARPQNTVAKKHQYKFIKQPTATTAVALCPNDSRIRILSKRFLDSYFKDFDETGRPNIANHYNDQAFFSFSAVFPTPNSRNLLLMSTSEDTLKLLFFGKTSIADQLRASSPTEHLVKLLSCDVPFYIVNPMFIVTMQLVVTGLFKEVSESTDQLRAFSRVFVLKQVSVDNQGEPIYEIFNDLFMLQTPTPDQIKKYHQNCQVTGRPPNSSTSLTRNQEDSINVIMSRTGMNRKGSSKLLEDCSWNENNAMEVFNNLTSSAIPREFFTR